MWFFSSLNSQRALFNGCLYTSRAHAELKIKVNQSSSSSFQIKTDTICVQSHKYRKLFSEWNLFFKKFMRHSREKKRKWTQYTVDSEREESVVGKSKSLRAKIPQSSNSALPLLTLLTSLCLSFLICKMGIIICLSYRILWWRVQIVSQIHSSFLSIWLIN